jgi:hypothetical protein
MGSQQGVAQGGAGAGAGAVAGASPGGATRALARPDSFFSHKSATMVRVRCQELRMELRWWLWWDTGLGAVEGQVLRGVWGLRVESSMQHADCTWHPLLPPCGDRSA